MNKNKLELILVRVIMFGVFVVLSVMTYQVVNECIKAILK
jgi:hypothetical protein